MSSLEDPIKGTSKAHNQEYDYFQLYDPDEYGLSEDEEVDVHNCLVKKSKKFASNERVNLKNELLWDVFVDCCCCHNYFWFEFRKRHLIVALVSFSLLATILGLGFGLAGRNNYLRESEKAIDPPLNVNKKSVLGKFSKAAISTDSADCAPIGLDVLKRGGTAVDSAIATLFCNGLYSSHSMGIGGGFFMTIYHKESGTVQTLDAREVAPSKSTVDMFHGDPNKSQIGGLAVGVPGEIKGYYSAKQRYGNPNITWASLLEPSIKMAEEGITVSWSLASSLASVSELVYSDPGLREIFYNPETNTTWKEGEKYKNLALAETFKRIAANGSDEFYSGQTAENLVADLQKLGGIITLEDMKNYNVVYQDPISITLENEVLYSIGPPASGTILAFILNILKNFNMKPGVDDSLMYHRIVEAFKWAYGQRSKLGDPFDPNITQEVNDLVLNMTSDSVAYSTFLRINDSQTVNDPSFYGGEFWNPDDQGTSHTCIVAPNGDAVSVTSTINLKFGAKIRSLSTGIIYNNQMDDFSSPNITNDFEVPPSPHNFIKPGKRPLSSMSPVIVTDKNTGKVRLVAGGSGGTHITTATALVVLKNLWLQRNIKESIDEKRIHHQLLPMIIDYESGLDKGIIDGLVSRGHDVEEDMGSAVVQGISLESDGFIYANADSRKAGAIAGF